MGILRPRGHDDAYARALRVDARLKVRQQIANFLAVGVGRVGASLDDHECGAACAPGHGAAEIPQRIAHVGLFRIEAQEALTVFHHRDQTRCIEQQVIDVAGTIPQHGVELLGEIPVRIEHAHLKAEIRHLKPIGDQHGVPLARERIRAGADASRRDDC